VALGRVIVRGQGLLYTLPVNPQFQDPNAIDPDRGVDMPRLDIEGGEEDYATLPTEATLGQAAMVARLALQMVPGDLQLRSWIGAQAKRRGGLGGLADVLMSMAPVPAAKARAAHRASLLRALQRSGPAQLETRQQQHATIRNPDYRQRIGRLAFTETKNRVVLGVTGHWDLGDDVSTSDVFRRFNSNLDPSDAGQAQVDRRARRIAESADGAGFIALVAQVAHSVTQPYGADLVGLHGLHMELQAPRRGAAKRR
jgi:hypothetical protein